MMMFASFLLSVLIASIHTCTGTYVVSYPNSLIPGIPLKIRIQVQNAIGNVNVRIGLKYVQNNTIIVDNTSRVKNGISTTLSLNVPATLIQTQYKVVISGSAGLVFQNESKIRFEKRGLLVFVQTDKSRYSASQTVKYRAVLLLPNLHNFQGQATVTIQDGKDNRIDVIGPIQVVGGMVSGKIELSQEPVFGSWKITVNAMGKSVSKSFEVNEYVLSRFNVELNVPSAINETQPTFTVNVKARFTFNADVFGNCTLLIYNKDTTWRNLELQSDLSGVITFTIPMTQLKSSLNINAKMFIRATVMDHSTLLTMVTERPLNIIVNKQPAVTITKVDAYKNSFVPGLTYHTKAEAQYGDIISVDIYNSQGGTREVILPIAFQLFVGRNNQPIGKSGSLKVTPRLTTAVLKTCTLASPHHIWLDVKTTVGQVMTIPFDESGYADLNYRVNNSNAQQLSFTIKFSDTTVQSYPASTTVVLHALRTNGMPIIRMKSDTVKAIVGESVAVTITSTENLNGKLILEIHSRGMRLETESIAVNNVLSTTHTITATKDMIPQAYISVSHLTMSGKLVADYIVVEVSGNPLRNEVNVLYNATQLEPRQYINMRITADPFSTVYVLVEDERNRIIGTGNDIFRSDVVNAIEGTGYSVAENIQRFLGSDRKRRYVEGMKRKLTKRSHGVLGDVDDTYIESGLVILSDAKVLEKNSYTGLLLNKDYKRQCVAPKQTWWFGSWERPSTQNKVYALERPSTQNKESATNTSSSENHTIRTMRKRNRRERVMAMLMHQLARVQSKNETKQSKIMSLDIRYTVKDIVLFDGSSNKLAQNDNNFRLDAEVDAKPQDLALTEIVRTKFPETWIWDEYNIGVSGQINFTKQIPDSLTTWVTSVFATNPNTGFGLTEEKQTFTVQKNFFVTMDIPSSIVLGEEFFLQMTAFNYDKYPKQVFFQITLSENPHMPLAANSLVPAGEGKSTFVLITPKSVGTLSINVLARVGFFSILVEDGLQKNVTVRPNGVYRTTNEQVLVHVKPGQVPYTKEVDLHDPVDMVSGTKFTKITITGDFMVPSIEGLGQLIRLPYGCGEQTMLNFAPAIYITQYLTIVGKLTAKIKENSMKSLNKGLQNELKYQRNDGSFSAFGNRDSSGSSWLSAFVLKCFGQAQGLITIDAAVMAKAMNWLLNCQQSDGAFPEPGRVIHYQMQAGTASGIKMTAFILIALLENRDTSGVHVPRLNIAITKGKQYLESKLSTASEVYTLAIVCYALASAGSSSSSTCYIKLNNAASLDDDKTYWEATRSINKREVNEHPPKTRALSADIEATSYALLTFMKLGKTSNAFRVVKWLVSQRNPTGGWKSTQDTILSLQALAEFSGSSETDPGLDYDVKFKIMGNQDFHHTYSITPATIDVLHTKEVPDTVDSIKIEASGEGSAVIDITTSYYVSGNENNDYIATNVSISKETVHSITVKPCLTWTGPVQSGMLIMEVEMPTGFQPDSEFLKPQNVIKRYETSGRNIVLYFDGLLPNDNVRCVHVKMDRVDPVVKSQACHVTVYDYYEPSHQAVTTYESGILKSANRCVICPHCNVCTGNS